MYDIKKWRDLINQQTVIYKQEVTLNVWLNDKAVGLTKLRNTQRMINLLCAAFRVMSYSFLNIFYSNKVAIIYSVDM